MNIKQVLLLFTLLVMTSISFLQNFQWAKRIGEANIDNGSSIIVDNQGNSYTTGGFNGTVDFDPGAGIYNLSSAGDVDIFILKLNASGKFLWAIRIGGSGQDFGRCIVIDKWGNVCVTGNYHGGVDFDPDAGTNYLPSKGYSELFILKLNSSGKFLWAKGIAGPDTESGGSIVTDRKGDIYVVGSFSSDTVDFDPGAGTYYLSKSNPKRFYYDFDGYILKLNSNGNFVWAIGIGGKNNKDEGVGSVSVDDSGNVYASGMFRDTVDFDPGIGIFYLVDNSYPYAGIFILKLGANGNFIWARSIGGKNSNVANSVEVDVAGNVYATGRYAGTVDFDPDTGTYNLTSMGMNNMNNSDIFVLKLDSSGNFVWAKSIGSSAGDVGYDITVDLSGNVYTTGYFWDTADFDPDTGTYYLSVPFSSGFILKLDSSGDFVWAKKIESKKYPNPVNAYSIALDTTSSVYVTGGFRDTADFDPGDATYNLISKGDYDIFILKLDSCSLLDSVKTIDGVKAFCANTSATYSIDSIIGAIGYEWSVPAGATIDSGQNGTSIKVTFGAASGNISVFPRNSCGSGVSKSMAVKVYSLPNVKGTITPDDTVCAGSFIALNGTGASNYIWTGGVSDGESFKIDSSDQFIVSGKDTNGCTGIDTILVVVNPLPKLGSIVSPALSVCAGSMVKLSGTGALSYTWSGGAQDGIPFVPSSNTYVLTGTDSNGCPASLSVMLDIMPKAKADFTTIDVCEKDTSIFVNQSKWASTYSWTFGDGKSSTAASPKHLYSIGSVSEKFTVTLIAIIANGCSDTIAKEVKIKKRFKAGFTAKDVCENDSVNFINQIEGSNMNYWRFGDGQFSSIGSPKHLYRISGTTTYFVTLRIENEGCSDSITKAVTVKSNPISDFSFVKSGNKFDFKASQKDNTSYQWKFGNGDSAASASTDYSYTYSQSSAYTVCLKVISADNCFSETCKTISTIGISEKINASGMRIYPNPNSGSFEVVFEKTQTEDVEMLVLDLAGRTVWSGIIESGVNNTFIQLPETAMGIYVLRVGGISGKLVVE